MLVYLDQAFRRRARDAGGPLTATDVDAAALEAASSRLRPVMLMVVSTIGGLMPLMRGTGAGAATMKRIAAPMIGGLVTATLLALVVIPILYSLWRSWQVRRGDYGNGRGAGAVRV